MTCEALINRFLLDYYAGTLPFWRKVSFRFHLGLCRACRKYVASYRQTVELTRGVRSEPVGAPPAELVEAILRITGNGEG